MQLTQLQKIAAALLLIACFAGAGCMKAPDVTVHEFMLEYPPPPPPKGPKLNAGLNIIAFTAIASYADTAIVYRSKDYQRAEFNYARWRVPPSQMVNDFLLRDFRTANVFEVIMPEDQGPVTRFRLMGSVEKFLADEVGGREAHLELLITLIDTAYARLPKRIVYQKRYNATSGLDGKEAVSIAAGMSRAMSQASQRIITDAYDGVSQCLTEGEPEDQQ